MQYTRGSIIYFVGDVDERIYILQKGAISLNSIDIETGVEITESVKEGEFFGVKSALGHFPREETVKVLVDSVAISLTVQEFETMFSSNKAVIMKMLQVFSNQLRGIHGKIKSILNSTDDVLPEDGMLNVAKCFFAGEKYKAVVDVCSKYLERFPNGSRVTDASRLLEAAKKRVPPELLSEGDPSVTSMQLSGAMKQFSLPIFDRFAKVFPPDSVIISEFEPGDCFYLVQAGQIQLLKTVNGSNKNLDILRPGEFFGEMAILENTPRSATCLTLETVQVLEFNKANFEALITGNPQIALILLKLFCKRIYDQRRRFKILVIKDPSARVMDVFLMFAELDTEKGAGERNRKFQLTPQDVAYWAGLPIDIVQDELRQMAQKRRLEIFDKSIMINNLAEMRRYVDQRKQQQPGGRD